MLPAHCQDLKGWEAMERNVGVAVLPTATVVSEVANHLLAAVPFEDGRHTEPVAMIYRKNRKLTAAMQNFIQALKPPEEVAR
jgi:DNA-binding transcriptional LysR family regulator